MYVINFSLFHREFNLNGNLARDLLVREACQYWRQRVQVSNKGIISFRKKATIFSLINGYTSESDGLMEMKCTVRNNVCVNVNLT